MDAEIHPSLLKRIRRKQKKALARQRSLERARAKRALERRLGRRASNSVKRAVRRRDSYTCRYCGVYPAFTMDHIVPFSRGGKTHYDNLATACQACQTKKDNFLLEEIGMELLPLHPIAIEFEKFWNERAQWGYFDDIHFDD